MNIAIAQIEPQAGKIQENIAQHEAMIRLAVEKGADFILFPELSLTGYEPDLAAELALSVEDDRLNTFQTWSNQHQITIGLGAPTQQKNGICISLLFFQPRQTRCCYSKKYLHQDEEPYFVPGTQFDGLRIKDEKLAFAICYEISVETHTEAALSTGATVFIASVAKFQSGIDKAYQQLSATAKKYAVPTLLCNCLGSVEGGSGECVGQSAIWDASGALLGQLGANREGLLFFNRHKKEVQCFE